MNYSANEQTSLVGPKASDTRGGYYGNQLRHPPSPTSSRDPAAFVRPSSPRPFNPPQPLQQQLDRAQQRHDQAHAITSRHWVVLALACLLLFGNYYCYDIPAALNVQLEEWMGTSYEVHQYQLNLLYSAYSLPNIILPLAGGYLIDRLSASRMLILFSLCICLGQGVFAIGLSFKSITAMVLGRFIFGIGGECLEVAQAKITTDWFKSRWLGLALGLNLSSARIGTALNDNLSPAIATTAGGVLAASWTGFCVCVLSLGCGIALAHLDGPASRKQSGVRVDAKDRKQEAISSPKDNIIGRQSLNVSSDSTMTLSSEAMEEQEEIEKENEMAEDDQMLYSEIFTLQTNFWILCLCCILLYGAAVPFNHISSDFLQKKWYTNNPTRAGTVMSIPDLVSSVGSPLCGYLIDRFGHRARYIPLSALLLIWAHTLLGFTQINPVLAMLVLGLAYSLFASALWPCIPFLVEDHQLGTAYGLVTIALNLSLTVFPMAVAAILHLTDGSYQWVEGLFIALAGMGFVLSIVLNILDQRQGGHLQMAEGVHAPLLDDISGYDHDPRRFSNDSRRFSQESRRYSREGYMSDRDMGEEDDMVTTKPVGEGIITIIPHRRRHSMAGFAGHLERARLNNYAQHVQTSPELNGIPGSFPNQPTYLSERRQ
ncbi:hypothetical protein BGZ74_005492 [Mortierella antarctica]|nr:hypothetical protein BGZ74_005492 [Mortierella antarctica]